MPKLETPCQASLEISPDVIVYCCLPMKHEGPHEPPKFPTADMVHLMRWWRSHNV